MADADGDGEVDLHEFKTKLAATKMAATKTVAKSSAKDKASLLYSPIAVAVALAYSPL